MEEKRLHDYVPPQIEVITFHTERGFIGSDTGLKTTFLFLFLDQSNSIEDQRADGGNWGGADDDYWY